MPLPNLNTDLPNNPDASSDMSVGSIQGANIPGYTDDIVSGQPDLYSQQLIAANNAQFAPQQIGPQGAGMYPGLRHNINVGSQSGSIIGSQGVYVPGGNIIAADPMLARRKALDDAARAKAASITPFDPGQPGKLKDPRFQEKFDRAYYDRANELVNAAQDKYGKDFGIVLQDPNSREGREFIQEMSNYETLRREFDGITDRIAGIDKGLETGELEFTDKTLALYDDYKQLVGSFDKGDIFKSRDLQSSIDQLDGFLSLEHYIQQAGFLDDIMGQDIGYSYNSDAGEFFETTTGNTVTYDRAVDQVTDSLARGPFSNHLSRGFMTKDDIKDTLNSRFKKQSAVKKSMQQKSAATIGAETEEIIADADATNKYNKENPGSSKAFSYDKNGNRVEGGDFMIKTLMDIPMVIKGKTLTIKERTPDGKIQETDFKGIPLNDVQLLTKDGQESIPGIVYAELEEISKLDDGTIIQKSRVAVPTTQENEEGEKFDSYSFEDRYIILKHKNGQGTGAMTEIKTKGLKDEESRESYDARIKEAEEWQGGGEKVGELD